KLNFEYDKLHPLSVKIPEEVIIQLAKTSFFINNKTEAMNIDESLNFYNNSQLANNNNNNALIEGCISLSELSDVDLSYQE
ncbi:5706_t:CDS:2, partial [Funneliformis geosporum]